MKAKRIWSLDTAEMVAAKKEEKYGTAFEVVPAAEGGWFVQEAVTAEAGYGWGV